MPLRPRHARTLIHRLAVGAPRFVLYAADPERGAALTARYPGLLEPAPRSPPDPSRLFIVRPDGYLGLSARDTAWDEAERYLRALATADGHMACVRA